MPDVSAVSSSSKRQYLIASVPRPGIQPMAANDLHQTIERMNGFQIVNRITSQGLTTFGLGGSGGLMPEVIVAETDVARGEALRATAPPHVIVEENAPLYFTDGPSGPADPFMWARASAEAALRPMTNMWTVLNFKVVGDGDRPLSGAMIRVYGRGFPVDAMTNGAGEAQVRIFGGGNAEVQAIYVKPAADHWERFITTPDLSDGVNSIQLRSFAQVFPGFPASELVGWGARLMRLDQIGADLKGGGIKIGIIDSGCDNTHPQLRHVANGMDFTNNGDPATWSTDTVSHGTHCAGVITGRKGEQVVGIRGFAPEAEVHSFKVFPGGRFDSLINALDQCIARRIDIVNMSLGSDQPSELVHRKILEARQNGVACIVAAGNSGGAVQFPGNVNGVLAVAALGKLNEYPADTNHAQNAMSPNPATGVYSAKFSCFGPQVAVSGPGVAIVSCMPGGGYAAWDGTSMAAPHITGLAALMLAHHPLLQASREQRNDRRVDQLFQLLRAGAVPYLGDALREGSGLPSLDRLLPATVTSQLPNTATVASAARGVIANLPPQGFAADVRSQIPSQSWAGPQQIGQQPGQMGPPQQPNDFHDIVAAAMMGNPMAIQAIWQLRSAGVI